MRTLVLLMLALSLAAGCGLRTRDNPSVPNGGVCQSTAQCSIDHTCSGCADEDAHCLPGCSTDADCSVGHCERLECFTCPCPGRCS